MPLLIPADQQLAKEEFARDRDNLTNIYLSQTTSLMDGARGVSDKQFNLNIALATISAAIIGIAIPVAETSMWIIPRGLFWTAVVVMSVSLLVDLIVSFGAIHYDRWTLDKQRVKLGDYFRGLLDSTTGIINKARGNTLTDEDIQAHYSRKEALNTDFSKVEGRWMQQLLDYGYYIYIGLFVIGLFLIAFTFIKSGHVNSRQETSLSGFHKEHV